MTAATPTDAKKTTPHQTALSNPFPTFIPTSTFRSSWAFQKTKKEKRFSEGTINCLPPVSKTRAPWSSTLDTNTAQAYVFGPGKWKSQAPLLP
jgi:hypothetical protein